MDRDVKNENPDWLDELQKKSWEPEILLSGIVLYGMFKMECSKHLNFWIRY